jgi:hypothetical protein
MHQEGFTVLKTLAAHLALMNLFCGLGIRFMGLLVSHQAIFGCVGFPTDVTHVRFFTSVYIFMFSELKT